VDSADPDVDKVQVQDGPVWILPPDDDEGKKKKKKSKSKKKVAKI
jgi:hypothetical protein